eukprot:767958-Hanusia_phi.AAC.12
MTPLEAASEVLSPRSLPTRGRFKACRASSSQRQAGAQWLCSPVEGYPPRKAGRDLSCFGERPSPSIGRDEHRRGSALRTKLLHKQRVAFVLLFPMAGM